MTAAAASANSLEATLASIDHAAGLTGLTADITYKAYTASIQAEDTESGKFFLKRAKGHDVRVLFDVKQPEAKAYSFSSEKVDIYLPKAMTVQEYDVGKYKSMVNQVLLLGFGSTSKELLSTYAVTLGGEETVGSEKATRLELAPKAPEKLMDVKHIQLWISDATGVVVQQKFLAESGDYKLATYSNLKIVPNLPDSSVRLDLPKGVKIEQPQK
jgi:outer membrane lipoprotein-sorting protein